MLSHPFKNQCDCRTFEIYKAYAAAFESAFYDHNWQELGSHFAEDISYEQLSPPVYSAQCQGRENTLSLYKTYLREIERRIAGTRSRGNILQMQVNGRYIQLSSELIYVFSDAPKITVPYKEQLWFNENNKIKKLIISMPAESIEQLINRMEQAALQLRAVAN